MKNPIFLTILCLIILNACSRDQERTSGPFTDGETIKISRTTLQDKIKGGWAGQVIGCTYGGPTEFKYSGTLIHDRERIPWDDNSMYLAYTNKPGLYDDIYMDLTFVEVFEKNGLNAPDSLHALAFTNAGYQLWHANQSARYNILNGIMPPASGHWKNNPHADDIDFQIEADFAGLMSPGMVNTASAICDKIGHIMNYGDGYYGGVYVAAMYSLSFVYNDINMVVREALKTIPEQSEFYQCIADVIKWHKTYPLDWKQTWFETLKKWSFDRGCPKGVFNAFNIDAKINAAYIVIGLLYGEGDFGKTIDISTRCGYDSDCNPASAGGILGTIIGYEKIPGHWKQGISKVEEMNFKYTEMSLSRVYGTGMRHALEMISKNKGTANGDEVSIIYQSPVPVNPENGFEGLYPIERKPLRGLLDEKNHELSFDFRGCGFAVTGNAFKDSEFTDKVLIMDLYVDNVLVESIKMPTNYQLRRNDVAWKYDLPEGNHTVKLDAKEIPGGYGIRPEDLIVYSSIDPGNANY